MPGDPAQTNKQIKTKDMKKTLFALISLAVAAAGCNKAEVISVDRQLIAFGEAFVDNATKADYSSTLIDAFKVYGTVTGNGNTVNVYEGADVTRGEANYGAAWTCDQKEYWIPSASYSFQAVVDGEIANGKIAYTVGQDKGKDGISDLLYATASATTNASAAPTGHIENGCVAFTFQHLLSKIGFTFTNGVTGSEKYTFKVNSISFTNHDHDGIYTIGTGWDTAVTPSTDALSFGAPTAAVTPSASQAATTTHQIIPGVQTLKVTVNYDILYNGKTVYAGMAPAAKEFTHTFAQGCVYNIVVNLPAPGQEIKFTVKEQNGVGAWTEGTGAELKY